MTLPPDLRPETRVALEAVNTALTIARRRTGAEDVTEKGERDLVTGADIAVEDAVRRSLADALSFPVVGEERGGEAPPDGAPYWLVDPICGTRNFASSIPLYCVNLALVERNEVTIAVVGNPLTGEIDVAEKGRGAWSSMADGRLRTSDQSLTIVVDDGKSKAAGARKPRSSSPPPSEPIAGTFARSGRPWPHPIWPPAVSRRTWSSRFRPSTPGRGVF